LLRAIYAADSPAGLRDLPAAAVLRRVWVQQYYAAEAAGGVRWRSKEDLPPAARMINSPHDPEARYPDKRSATWIGYKGHVTETCDPDAPHLITHVETTPATTPDCEQLPTIHRALARKDLLPRERLVDAGYPDGAILADSLHDHGVAVIGPVPPDVQWQSRAQEGFDGACSAIDWEARAATCPAGCRSRKWETSEDRYGNQMIHLQFARQDCQACPHRAACTTSRDGRRLTVRPKDQHLALGAARRFQATPDFAALHRARAGVEGTISQGLRVADLRHARYIGLAKTRLQHVLTAAALNVLRVAHWLADEPLAQTRQAPFLTVLGQAA
jgi:transposase